MLKNRILPLLILLLPTAGFGLELSLPAAERLAIESSPEIRNAREQISLAALKNQLDLRNFLPSIDLSYSSSRQTNFYAEDSDSIQLGIDISQPLFDGGRTLKSRKLTEIQLGLQASSLELQIEQLRNQVWKLYFSLLMNREKLKLQRELLEISIQQLSIALRKYEMGALTELDYLEAAVEVRNIEIEIFDTENSEQQLCQDLAVIMGFDPRHFAENPLKLTGSIKREYPGAPLWADDYRAWVEISMDRNLELKQQQASLHQLKAEYDVLQTSFIPTVSLAASLYVQGTAFPLQQPGCSFSLQLDFPYDPLPSDISLGGGLQGSTQYSTSSGGNAELLPALDFVVNQKNAELKLKQSSEALEDAETALERSIRTALEQLEYNRLKMTLRRSTQDLQKKRLVILETRNKMGEIKELDLLQQRIDFYQEEISIMQGVLELMQFEREFEKLLGIGLGQLDQLSVIIHGNANIFSKDGRL